MNTREQIQALEEEKLNLQSKLQQGDYKVTKCAEAELTQEPMPYDVNELHAERQAMRARINEIEEQLPELYEQLKQEESERHEDE